MIVLGIDPGMAAGKPIAIAAADITPERLLALWHCESILSAGGAIGFQEWMEELQDAVISFQPALIAVEDALAPNLRSAAALQNVVMAVALVAQSTGVPIIKIHPSRVRPAIAFNGRTPDSADVVATINMLFHLALADAQHDIAFAYAIAVAGEAQWRVEQILETAK